MRNRPSDPRNHPGTHVSSKLTEIELVIVRSLTLSNVGFSFDSPMRFAELRQLVAVTVREDKELVVILSGVGLRWKEPDGKRSCDGADGV